MCDMHYYVTMKEICIYFHLSYKIKNICYSNC